VIDLLIADLAKDGEILKVARECATEILEEDTNLELPKNLMIKEQVDRKRANESNWARIS
jgi:ATP-dependent DNA helicase RecG